MKLLVMLALLGCAAAAAAAPQVEFPPTGFIPGWKADHPARYRTTLDMFGYMNGGAELYLEYIFRELRTREYHRDGGDLTIEAYRFDRPEDAYGVFSLDTSGVEVEGLGQGCRAPDSTQGGTLRFWKDVHYVRIFAWQYRPELGEVIMEAARRMDRSLDSTGALPPWLEALRGADLDPVFVRGSLALTQVAGSLAPEDPLFNRNTGGAWIPADSAAGIPACLLLRYADPEEAGNAFEQTWQRLSGGAEGVAMGRQRGLARGPRGVAGLELAGEAMLWVPRAPNEEACATALDRVKEAWGEE